MVSDEDDELTPQEVDAIGEMPCRCTGGFTCTPCLIAKSSVGVALADVRERGIEAHLADEATTPERKKRRKGTSPTARTLAECRKRGWDAQVVERPWNKHTKKTLDLFGVIDLIAIVPPVNPLVPPVAGDASGILGIQATTGAHHADRREKILAETRARKWVDAGGRLELWTWSMTGACGKRKRWTLRVETYAEMVEHAREAA